MSFDNLRLVLVHSQAKKYPKLVLLCIADHISRYEGYCYLTYRTLKKDTGLSERKLRDIIRYLECDLKELHVTRRKGCAPLYRLTIEHG